MHIKDIVQELQSMDQEELNALARALAPLAKAVVTDILYNVPSPQTHPASMFYQGGHQGAASATGYSALDTLKKFFDNCQKSGLPARAQVDPVKGGGLLKRISHEICRASPQERLDFEKALKPILDAHLDEETSRCLVMSRGGQYTTHYMSHEGCKKSCPMDFFSLRKVLDSTNS